MRSSRLALTLAWRSYSYTGICMRMGHDHELERLRSALRHDQLKINFGTKNV